MSVVELPYSGEVNPTTGETYTEFESYSTVFEDPLVTKLRELQAMLYRLEQQADLAYFSHPLVKAGAVEPKSTLGKSLTMVRSIVNDFKLQLISLEFSPIAGDETPRLLLLEELLSEDFRKAHTEIGFAIQLMGMSETLRSLFLDSFTRIIADIESIRSSLTPRKIAVQCILESLSCAGLPGVTTYKPTLELYLPLCELRNRYFDDASEVTLAAYVDACEKLLSDPRYLLAVDGTFDNSLGELNPRLISIRDKLLELEVTELLELIL